ncbi:hypothetical protein RB623_03615 [Mesorhizobium sp. LHD-90]|uniref:hypothetical protein n=1 Tax=Mesorhizobium sp. LHD-90 TaxID=3071414 RepID=UPI0027E159D5|nr:hypothetical protein [Mesorhizobium sp. LHD-90]MDQ6433137.1 hypothetical protein [Mesorhizobium sp. LHD-90]
MSPSDTTSTDVEKIGSYPQRDTKSYTYDVLEAAVASIPGAGAGLQKLMQSLGFDPYRKREEEFLDRLGRAVEDLQKRQQLDIAALHDNPYFEGLINDIRDKFRSARSEAKKQHLIDAATNAVSGIMVDDAVAGRFLSFIEQFSPGHVLMLRLLQNPKANPSAVAKMERVSMGGLSDMMEAAFSNGEIARDAIPVIYDDLHREKLVEGGLNVTMSGSGLMEKRTTTIGDAFIRFLSPVETG